MVGRLSLRGSVVLRHGGDRRHLVQRIGRVRHSASQRSRTWWTNVPIGALTPAAWGARVWAEALQSGRRGRCTHASCRRSAIRAVRGWPSPEALLDRPPAVTTAAIRARLHLGQNLYIMLSF